MLSGLVCRTRLLKCFIDVDRELAKSSSIHNEARRDNQVCDEKFGIFKLQTAYTFNKIRAF